MGKDATRARLLPIDDNEAADESCTKVICTFRTVSVRNAQCSSPDDREKMLVIIESSFSTLRAFDKYISTLLIKVRAKDVVR